MNILTKSKRIGTQPAYLWREAAQQKCLQLLASGRERLAAAAGDAEAWGRLKAEWTTFLHEYLEDTRPDFGSLCAADMLHETTYDGFRLQNIRLTLSSGWQIGLNLFLPPAAGPTTAPYVPVLCPCGHGPKWLDDHQIPPQVLARNGFAAALFDMPMFGERACENDHFVQGAQALMAGWWSNHFFLVDALQVADYLQTRAEIDFTHGMAVTGVSGGGFSTLFLAQMDPRVTVIAPVCSVASLRGHIISGLYTGCLENYVRGQFLHGLDLDHLLCLAAPLPCLVIGGRRDDMFRWENMQHSVEQAQRIYASENAAGKLAFFVDESEHRYTRRMAGETAAWFRRWLLQAGPLPTSADTPLLPREALDCGTADHSRTIFGFVRDAATAMSTQRSGVASNAAIMAALGIRPQDASAAASLEVLEVEVVQPETPWHYAGMQCQIIHPANDLPLPLLYLDFPTAPEGTLVCFGDTGKLPPVRMGDGLWELRRRVLSADLRGFGELAPAASPYDLYSWCSIDRALYDLLFLCGEDSLGQQTLDALRVLNTTLSVDSPGEVIVYGHGEAALPALFAGLLHPRVSRIVLDHYPCSFESLATHPAPAWQRYLYVANILKAFDIPDLVRARTDKQFLLIHPLDARKQLLDEIAALRLYGPELPNAAVHAAMGDVALKAVVSAWLNHHPASSDQPVDPTLALHGGKPVCDTALPSKWHGADLIGQAELHHLQEVVRTKTPFRHYGPTGHKPRMAETLERRVADLFGVKYALAVTSGSAALSCALAGLGVGPGDEVILPAFAWISCYNAIVLAGALPVFCDIDESLTIDPADFEQKITPATKAVLVVHYQGGPARMDAIQSIARRHGVKVLEDSAQSAGARYQGHYLGSLGDLGILSFQTAKVVTSGEGGMVLTDDAGIFEQAVRYHDLGFLRPTFDAQLLRQAGGAVSDEELARRQFSVDATFAGNQYRMNELSAAVALAQIDRLDWAIERCHTAWDFIQHRVAASELPIHFRRSNDYAGDGGITLFVDLGSTTRAHSFKDALAAEIPNLGPSSHVSNLLAEDYVLARRMAHPNLPPFGPGFNGEKVTYTRELALNADALPARMVAIGIGPRYTRRHAEIIAAAIVKVYGALFGENE